MTLQDSDSPTQVVPKWQLFSDADRLASQATQDILNAAATAIERKGAFHIVLAGGTTPKHIYKQLAHCSCLTCYICVHYAGPAGY